ncbi:MAG: flagellar basal-body MS-ring/collar protein FliF [bacterium]|jgi:flagellar M-ring protein FliF
MKAQLQEIIGRLSARQRILIVAAAVAAIAGLVVFTRWRSERDFKPLYTELAPEDASAVVAKLRELGAEYKLSENGTAILVRPARLADLRIQLAGAGLPRTGRVGFELFDRTNLGVTEFAEQINYRRALEGELERSVTSLTEVQQARVHLTFPRESVFVEQRQPAKASVMVKLRPGARLEQANVVAIANLIASAVEGLAPEAVSIVDMQGRLLNRPRIPSPDGEQPSEAMLAFSRQLERDLVSKINATLEPLLGADRFRAGVSVECDFSSGEQSEEVFDPAKSVMASSQKSEDASGLALAAGVPGTASALPRPTSRPGVAGNGISRRVENVVYQTSRVVKHTKLPQGAIKRISMAVLVDHTVRWEGNKRILEAPSPERLQTIRELVAAATGFNAERGDQLTVESLPFDSTLRLEPPPTEPAAPPSGPGVFALRLPDLPPRVLAIAGACAGALLLVLLAIAALVIRARRRKKRATANMQPALPPVEDALEKTREQLEAQLAEHEALNKQLEEEALSSLKLKLPAVATKKAEVLTKHLVEATKKDPVAAAHVVRSWLYDIDRCS